MSHLPGALTEERRRTHGEWQETALIAHELRSVIERAQLRRRLRGQPALAAHQIEALGQIGFKAARIIAGDPDWPDHWNDIAGYAMLGIEPRSSMDIGGGSSTLRDATEAELRTPPGLDRQEAAGRVRLPAAGGAPGGESPP